MKLLLFSDLHVDSIIATSTSTPFGVDVEAAKREIRLAFTRICALARDLRVDAVCCGGNLYDQATATSATGDLLREGFAGLEDMPVYLAPGSSDWLHPTSLYARVGWSHNVHIFDESSLVEEALGDGVVLWGAAHTGPVHDEGFLDHFDVGRPGIHLALFHGCERTDFLHDRADGLVDGEITAAFEARQIAESGLTHALLGHLQARGDAALYTYPATGSPRGGAVVVTVDAAGAIRREWHQVVRAHRPSPRVARAVPAWIGEILDSVVPVDMAGLDRRTVRGRFVADVEASRSGEDQRRVLRAGLLAMQGRLADEEE